MSNQRIYLMRRPAPKPLSTFMTAILGTHELSIAKRAVNPPRLVPYPVDVGTAIIGLSLIHQQLMEALHSCNNNDNLASLIYFIVHKPVKPGNSDIIQSIYFASQENEAVTAALLCNGDV